MVVPSASAVFRLTFDAQSPSHYPYQDCLTQTFQEILMGLGIPPLKFKIMLESNPPKSIIISREIGRTVLSFACPIIWRASSHALLFGTEYVNPRLKRYYNIDIKG